mmetsp:Transcript_139310/g.388776  ORF Transcript_139310/g.388776 Transcript_139310/m.388776 type:complete len:203 (-) Transcript_139310:538-1146(-)
MSWPTVHLRRRSQLTLSRRSPSPSALLCVPQAGARSGSALSSVIRGRHWASQGLATFRHLEATTQGETRCLSWTLLASNTLRIGPGSTTWLRPCLAWTPTRGDRAASCTFGCWRGRGRTTAGAWRCPCTYHTCRLLQENACQRLWLKLWPAGKPVRAIAHKRAARRRRCQRASGWCGAGCPPCRRRSRRCWASSSRSETQPL